MIRAFKICEIRSELDDIIHSAYREMPDLWNTTNEIKDLNTAVFVIALRQIVNAY